MAVAGAYLLTQRVTVTSGFWGWWGDNTFGLTLVPLLLGIGVLFFNGRSALGWVLTIGGTVIILAGNGMPVQAHANPGYGHYDGQSIPLLPAPGEISRARNFRMIGESEGSLDNFSD